jgi:hypothetical protein
VMQLSCVVCQWQQLSCWKWRRPQRLPGGRPRECRHRADAARIDLLLAAAAVAAEVMQLSVGSSSGCRVSLCGLQLGVWTASGVAARLVVAAAPASLAWMTKRMWTRSRCCQNRAGASSSSSSSRGYAAVGWQQLSGFLVCLAVGVNTVGVNSQ